MSMSSNKTYYNRDLYETYAEYVEVYDAAQAEYLEDAEAYEDGIYTQKPRKEDYAPDEEDYFMTQTLGFLKFIPKDYEKFQNIIDKTADDEKLNSEEQEFLEEYVHDLLKNQKKIKQHAKELQDELIVVYKTSGIDVDTESINKIPQICRAQKRLYKEAKKYMAEHQAEYAADVKDMEETARTEQLKASLKDAKIITGFTESDFNAIPRIDVTQQYQIPEQTNEVSENATAPAKPKSRPRKKAQPVVLGRNDENPYLSLTREQQEQISQYYASARKSDAKMKATCMPDNNNKLEQPNDATKVSRPIIMQKISRSR